jgi:WD40 repeat protein
MESVENYEGYTGGNKYEVEKMEEIVVGWKVWSVAVDGSEEVLAVVGASQSIETYRITDGRVCKAMSLETHHEKAIRSVDISRDGALLLTGSFDGTCELWSLYAGEMLSKVEGPESEVKCARISPGKDALALSTRDGSVWVCRVDQDSRTVEIEEILDYSERDVKSVLWDGDALITTGYSGEVVVYRRWDDEDLGEVKWEIEQIIEETVSTVWMVVRIEEESPCMAMCSDSGAVLVYRKESGVWKKSAEYKGSVFPVTCMCAVLSDGDLGEVAFVNNRESIAIANMSLKVVSYHGQMLGHGDVPTCITFLRKRSLLLIGTLSGKILVYAVRKRCGMQVRGPS